MRNITVDESVKLELGLFELGEQLGEYIRTLMEEKGIEFGAEGKVIVTMNDIAFLTSNMKRNTFLKRLGSQEFASKANGAVSIVGMGTTGFSAKNYLGANNLAARCCYAGGVLFGGCGMISSGISCLTGVCQFNSFGFITSGASGVFLCLGNSLNQAGLMLEGKPGEAVKLVAKPRRISKALTSGNIAFSIPAGSASYSRILQGGLVILTIYSYSKVIIASYKRGQNLIFHFNERRRSKLVFEQAKYLSNKLGSSRSVSRARMIGYFALVSP